MSRMHGYRELLEKEVVEAWRTYRLAVVCVLFIVVGIAAPVVTRYLPELARLFGPAEELGLEDLGVLDVVDLFVRNLAFLGAIVAILLAMGSVAGERERGTLPLVLSRPVSRAAVLWAKFVALGMILGLGTALAVLAAWLYTSLLFGPQPALPWVQLGLIAWLSTMVYAAITFAGSASLPSSLGAAAVGLATLAVLTVLSAIGSLGRFLPVGLTDVARAQALEETSPDLVPAVTVAVSLGVIVAALAVAWWRFRNDEA